MGGHGGLNILPQKSWNGTKSFEPSTALLQSFGLITTMRSLQCTDSAIARKWQRMKKLSARSKDSSVNSRLEVTEWHE